MSIILYTFRAEVSYPSVPEGSRNSADIPRQRLLTLYPSCSDLRRGEQVAGVGAGFASFGYNSKTAG